MITGEGRKCQRASVAVFFATALCDAVDALSAAVSIDDRWMAFGLCGSALLMIYGTGERLASSWIRPVKEAFLHGFAAGQEVGGSTDEQVLAEAMGADYRTPARRPAPRMRRLYPVRDDDTNG